MNAFLEALEAFLGDEEEFREAVLLSTRLGWGGGAAFLEMFEDGSYRIIPSHQLGNLYQSPGLIVEIPSISDEEMLELKQTADYDISEALREAAALLRDHVAEIMEDLP